jgi:antitoxin VapB
MALNIKDPEAERLAAEVAALAGETKTRAVRVALAERRERLSRSGDVNEITKRRWRFLEEEIWPRVPRGVRGKRISKRERERILGYGRWGV